MKFYMDSAYSRIYRILTLLIGIDKIFDYFVGRDVARSVNILLGESNISLNLGRILQANEQFRLQEDFFKNAFKLGKSEYSRVTEWEIKCNICIRNLLSVRLTIFLVAGRG